MLDKETRRLILRLRHEVMCDKRAIARILSISRSTVNQVLRRGTDDLPTLARSESAVTYTDRIRELCRLHEGNLAAVHRVLVAGGAPLPYSTLTAFCRRHGIGVGPKPSTKARKQLDPAKRARLVRLLQEALAEYEDTTSNQ